MAMDGVTVYLLLFLSFTGSVFTDDKVPEFVLKYTQNDTIQGISKSLYNASLISAHISCKSNMELKPSVVVQWVLREANCLEEYEMDHTSDNYKAVIQQFFDHPSLVSPDLMANGKSRYWRSEKEVIKCDDIVNYLEEYQVPKTTETSEVEPVLSTSTMTTTTTTIETAKDESEKTEEVKEETKDKTKEEKSEEEQKTKKRVRRQADEKNKLPAAAAPSAAPAANTTEKQIVMKGTVIHTWSDGIYLFVLKVTPEAPNTQYEVTANIWMKGKHGYLEALLWPLLPFFATMCVVYVIYAIIWMVLIFCNWRDLLRIQFWIGGVIFLGMLEKAVYLGQYETLNATGSTAVKGGWIFAELVSCMKRTLARMLVVIVSLGFGIVKPRLGPMLHKVMGMGALYFILASVEGCLRIINPGKQSNQRLLADIPLAVLDAAICWWVFTSLVQTTRTLRLRRNLIKLSLYRHFTNTLIFAVLASVIFMIWQIKQHRLTTCIRDWKEIWVDDAYWRLLFSLILLVIMFLWRPTNNNQRYAFSPLLDAADDDPDDEEEPPVMNDAFEDSKEKLKDRKKEGNNLVVVHPALPLWWKGDGMKMRGVKGQSNGSPNQKEAKNKAEDDLKWIEENIPTSVTDTALPSLLDSDEEIMTTKFEMSKME